MLQIWTQAGRRHGNDPVQNQDAVVCREMNACTVLTVADGVSTCPEGRRGARIVSGVLADLLLWRGLDLAGEAGAEAWLVKQLLRFLSRTAQRQGRPVEDYSSTAAGILVDRRAGRLLFFHLGDSMILAVGRGKIRILGMPADSTWGCPVTTTRDAARSACLGTAPIAGLTAVLLCTDGAWRHMFAGGRLKLPVREMLSNGDYEGLKQFVLRQNGADDASFAALSFRKEEEETAWRREVS